jgi:polar amino acid transport system substrate-binding protein
MLSAMGATAAASLMVNRAKAEEAVSTLDAIQKRGYLLAGARYDYPPGSFADAQGVVQGYGPDVAREFAKHLGVECRFVQTTSQTRIPLLLNGQIDAEFGPTTNSKVREEVVDFSLIWNTEQAVILVRKGEPTDPKEYAGTDKTIGATQGAVYIGYWKATNPDAKFKLFQQYPELLLAVAQGQVDCALIDSLQAELMIAKMPDVKLEVGKPFFRDSSAIMVRQNDSKWRNWVNWALQRLWIEGKLQEIYRKYYNEEPTFVLWQPGMMQPGVVEVHGPDKW